MNKVGDLVVTRLLIVCAFALLTLGGCANEEESMDAQQSEALSIRTVLIDQVRICTETIGYDPDKIKVAENKIAPNEIKWRQCVYDAIHAYARSHPPLRDMYESLVAEDIAMTTAIQDGNFTRTDCRQRIERLLDQITTAEQQHSQHDLELSRQVFNWLRLVNGLR